MTLAEFRALAERAIRVEREGAAEKRDGWALTDFHRAASPTAVIALIDRRERAEAFIAKPAKHRFWRPGEADCPRDIKPPNGELHTLRCKVCGEDDPRDQICRATYFDAPAGEGEADG